MALSWFSNPNLLIFCNYIKIDEIQVKLDFEVSDLLFQSYALTMFSFCDKISFHITIQMYNIGSPCIFGSQLCHLTVTSFSWVY
jgi:hypothetical protein